MKKLLLFAAVLAFSTSASFADALLFAVNHTPYDHQMSRVQPYLASSGASSRDVSMNVVNQWMTDLRSIPYGFTQVWKTPEETVSTGSADCKAKAVALYDRMIARGARNVRLVIGRRTPMSRSTHAWLSWETANGSYVLDPTFNWAATPVSAVGQQNYVPLYAYAGAKKYRAAASGSTLIAQN